MSGSSRSVVFEGIAWVPIDVVVRVHDQQLARHGGMAGIRARGGLESALDRAKNLVIYIEEITLEALAAALAVGIAKNHPFVDGNKRTACVVSLMFLRMNDVEVIASEEELERVFLGVADGSISEAPLAEWFYEHAIAFDDS